MANWQASLLMQTLSTGSVLVLQRDKIDQNEVPTLHGGDTFFGSLPDGDPFGGTVIERHDQRPLDPGAGDRHRAAADRRPGPTLTVM